MRMKKISLYWSALLGLISIAWQVGTYYVRFGKWNEFASPLDYVMFFLAGTLGGLIAIYFLNRQTTKVRWWVVLIAFLLASPIAFFMMIGGGMLGPLGVLIFPQLPWALFTWIGTLIAKLFSRGS